MLKSICMRYDRAIATSIGNITPMDLKLITCVHVFRHMFRKLHIIVH